MAGQAKKKEKKEESEYRMYTRAVILLVTFFYIAVNAYAVYFKGYEFTRSDTLGFLFLNIINFTMYRAIVSMRNSFIFNYLLDILGVNLVVMVGINFHWKFWYFYLIIPGYLIFKGCGMLYEYVKGIGKETPEDQMMEAAMKSRDAKGNSTKEKKQIVKIKQ